MIGKIEMVQEFPVEGIMIIRVNCYREVGDVGHEEHHVQVPVIPESGYTGEVDAMGMPVDAKDYKAWVATLPKIWKNNPCLNTFIALPIGTPQGKIETVISAHLKRLKDAPVDAATGYPKVIDSGIQGGLKKHLQSLRIAVSVKPTSISGKDAVKNDHMLLKVQNVRD
jgi:hypothetical protein